MLEDLHIVLFFNFIRFQFMIEVLNKILFFLVCLFFDNWAHILALVYEYTV